MNTGTSERGQGSEGTRNGGLPAALGAWKDIEPEFGFEAAVWRGIRSSTGTATLPPGFFDVIRTLFPPRPLWSTGIAAAAAVVLGVGLAVGTMRAPLDRGESHALLHPRTVAGSYVTLALGDQP